jgi:two-component system chemotaxis sensor kinase CheA
MNEDLAEELQLFLEDMDDQLTIMETTLLDISELSLEEIDKEMINNLFRAMHTMKGNAGIFGYDLIINFAHKAENLLDLIRNDKIVLHEELIELFLLIKDHSKLLVELTTQDIALEGENKQQHDFLLEELSTYLNREQNEIIKEITPEIKNTQEYDIKVKLKNEFFESGMEMQSIIRYLAMTGKIIDLKLIEDDIPSFDKFDPKKAYIQFHIQYKTEEEIGEIEEAFEFVQEDIDLEINLVSKEKPQENTNSDFKIFKKPHKKIEPKNIESKKNHKIETSMSLRVDSSKIDTLINQISEMVIANAKITQYAHNSKDTEFEESVTTMSEMLEEIRDGVMNIRMVQVGDSFSKLRRIVTDTAKKLSKEISFEIVGEETELDKTVIEKISDPIVHMLRNSIDHGIETPEVRKEHNKNKKGNIVLKAFPDAGTIVIQIIDDGAGIDKEHVFKQAIEKNIIGKNITLSDKEIFNLLFSPGFSTAKELSSISGRGVGMDVVKRNIEELRGNVEIESILGKGTTVTIRLPLTLAIIDGFLVQVGDSKYIIPLDNIQECLELTSSYKKQFLQNGYITLRKNILPILDVAKHFEQIKKENIKENKRENIVVVRHGRTSVGLKVDELFGEFQTVIKPLGKVFENVSDISGGTILGTGEIALIFDVQKLIKDKISQKEV